MNLQTLPDSVDSLTVGSLLNLSREVRLPVRHTAVGSRFEQDGLGLHWVEWRSRAHVTEVDEVGHGTAHGAHEVNNGGGGG